MIKDVAYAYGEARVLAGEWRRVFDEYGRHVGYQPVAVRFDATSSSDPSRAALGKPEMRALAGELGASRTARMGANDPERAGRRHPKSGRLLPEEDFVERARNLVTVYPHSANFADIRRKRAGLAPGGDRAVRVYPRDAACAL